MHFIYIGIIPRSGREVRSSVGKASDAESLKVSAKYKAESVLPFDGLRLNRMKCCYRKWINNQWLRSQQRPGVNPRVEQEFASSLRHACVGFWIHKVFTVKVPGWFVPKETYHVMRSNAVNQARYTFRPIRIKNGVSS